VSEEQHPTAVFEALAIASDSDDDGPISYEDLPRNAVGMLMVLQGPKRGSRISLDTDEVTIGRHPESDIFLDDVTVSRRHAELRLVDDAYEVSDAGSLNGTYVNQERVERQVLRDGDELQVGKFKLVYVALVGRV
jgi:pSer/pThr/pTyr-binding forkhead associated (FHA) protein